MLTIQANETKHDAVDLDSFKEGNLLIAEDPQCKNELYGALHSLHHALPGVYAKGTTLLLSSRTDWDARHKNNSHFDCTRLAQGRALRRMNATHQGGKRRLFLGNSEEIISHIRNNSLHLEKIDHFIIDGVSQIDQKILDNHLQFIYSKFPHTPPTILMVDDTETEERFQQLSKYFRNRKYINLKEREDMKDKRKYHHIAQDQRKAQTLKSIAKKMVSDSNPHELNSYRTLIRKNINIFRRAYLAGYLFKLLDEAGSYQTVARGKQEPRGRRRLSRSTTRNTRETAELHNAVNGVACLYINVGKNNGVNENAINKLFSTISSKHEEGIKQVKVFDHYSFVYIISEFAQDAIKSLNGVKEFDRTMVVSYSKKGNRK